MSDIASTLQQRFELIHRERMAELPMVNPALQVAVIGFDKSEHGCLGVLITPWCMNLVLLPEGDEWAALSPGSKQQHSFPSGVYEFVVADEPGVGRYQSCSLFSPMFEFGDQATALATAEAALLAVMNGAMVDERALGQPLWRDVDEMKQSEAGQPQLSRRDFLRGRFG
jgi:[NiFe] hydrogenase assembly HybE family chaperone